MSTVLIVIGSACVFIFLTFVCLALCKAASNRDDWKDDDQ